jgi:hypothetical protein
VNKVIIMNEKHSEILMKCYNEIEMNHGRHALHRYQRLIENNSNALDRELKDEEIYNLYNEFNNELCRTLFTREGK